MAADYLKKVYLFKDLPVSELEELSKLVRAEKVHTGTVIFSQDDLADALYVVKYGSVRIKTLGDDGEELGIKVLGAGSHFGEMSFVDGRKRSASAEALEVSELLRIDYRDLGALFAAQPLIAAHFYQAIAYFLCGRLLAANEELGHTPRKRAA